MLLWKINIERIDFYIMENARILLQCIEFYLTRAQCKNTLYNFVYNIITVICLRR